MTPSDMRSPESEPPTIPPSIHRLILALAATTVVWTLTHDSVVTSTVTIALLAEPGGRT